MQTLHFPYKSENVLIVDDDRFVLESVKNMLSGLGFAQIFTADTVKQAIDYISAQKLQIQLVITDLNMPDSDGLELLQYLGDISYEGDVLLFSGEDQNILKMSEKLASELQLSVIGSMQKPVMPSVLREALFKRPSVSARQPDKSATRVVSLEMLYAAIQERQIQPWFQPKLDIASKTPVGVEVLSRWPNSPIGPVFPDEFIPLAEKHGLIDDLTLLIISQVIEIRQGWLNQGIDLEIAINLSMDSLTNEDFPRKLVAAIEHCKNNLSKLKFEVTESRLMENLAKPLEILLRLKMKKVKLSIDDFGTGHSNLTQLRDLPFDELKLDRSYVQVDEESERNSVILESSIDIAKKLNILTVAEGIERLSDWQRLEKLGCDQVQGYLLARPMPAEELVAWLKQWPSQRKHLFGMA